MPVVFSSHILRAADPGCLFTCLAFELPGISGRRTMRPVERKHATTPGLRDRTCGRGYLTMACIAIAVGQISLSGSEPALAIDHTGAVRHVVETRIRPWINTEILLDAVRRQNDVNRSLTSADIESLDAQWRQETLSSERPLISAVLATELSGFLRDKQTEQRGLFTEIFVVDNRGLNVGQSDVTSDYWQGDEEKWQRTFLIGPDEVFIDGVEQDESTQQFQSQVSLSISDPQTGNVIGSITVGVDVDRALDLLP